ncbi:hypothetical protein J6590_039523 [Homalodisca vitripennis]|nr:hypothetical protein J6590_039523 [Homalodisca vitripennis]
MSANGMKLPREIAVLSGWYGGLCVQTRKCRAQRKPSCSWKADVKLEVSGVEHVRIANDVSTVTAAVETQHLTMTSHSPLASRARRKTLLVNPQSIYERQSAKHDSSFDHHRPTYFPSHPAAGINSQGVDRKGWCE